MISRWKIAVLSIVVAVGGAESGRAQNPLNDILYALDNGDVNGDMVRDVSDAVYLMSHLFLGGPPPTTLALCGGEETPAVNGDSNADGTLDISDGIHILNWMYLGGDAPVSACEDGTGGHRFSRRPRIVPPRGIFRKIYSKLAGTWWQWAMSIPFDGHPLNDGECGVAQPLWGVWYLGGSFASDTAVRECTVPRGRFICFPIINVECSSVEVDTDFFCDDETSCLACNDQFLSDADTLTLTVDGHAIRNLQRFRVQSKLFEIDPLPEGNIFGAPEGTTGVSLGDGYYILLTPLSPGKHSIVFSGCFDAFGGCEGFELNIEYDITVQ